MISWTLAAGLAGGLGLFLLGISMLTDGLRLAAGPALERILAAATRTRWHALGSGVLMAAVVQSSTAIIVAAIGFVNAGLLGLGPSIWVLFGSSLGSTMTAWMVALVGPALDIEIFALPMIGVGVALRLTGRDQRRSELGSAIAGFGLLLLGIGMLREAFGDLASRISLPQGEGPLAVVGQVAAGMLITVLVQASSGTTAIAITAAQSGLLTAPSAAAVMIGASLGTIVTATLATIGATSNAQRAASAYVAFNLIAATVALVLLPWLVDAIAQVRAALGLAPDTARQLAAFLTTFKLIGVALMWPLSRLLTRWLRRRFRAREEDEAQPRHLDETVLAVPSLAIDAFQQEVLRIGQVANRLARAALTGAEPRALQRDQAIATALVSAAEAFVDRVNRGGMPDRDSERLAAVLRILRYHESVAEQSLLMSPLVLPSVHDQRLTDLHTALMQAADRLFVLSDPAGAPASADELEEAAGAMETAYQAIKAGLLDSGAIGSARLTEMDDALRRYSALRRATQQAVKAWQRMLSVRPLPSPAPSDARDAPDSARASRPGAD